MVYKRRKKKKRNPRTVIVPVKGKWKMLPAK